MATWRRVAVAANDDAAAEPGNRQQSACIYVAWRSPYVTLRRSAAVVVQASVVAVVTKEEAAVVSRNNKYNARFWIWTNISASALKAYKNGKQQTTGITPTTTATTNYVTAQWSKGKQVSKPISFLLF